MSVEVVIAVVSALAGLLAVGVSVLRLPVERRKGRADAAAAIASAAGELVDDLREEICRLQVRVESLEALAEKQSEVIGELRRQLEEAEGHIRGQAQEIGRLQSQVMVLQRENERLTRQNRELARRTGMLADPDFTRGDEGEE